MKWKIAGLLALAIIATAYPAHAADTWALVVGCGKFTNNFITPLRFAGADAVAVHDALVDPQLGALPADHVMLLTDDQATGEAIKGSIDTFFRPKVKPGDQIIIYLASHGVAKGVGLDAKSYFLPHDVAGLTSSALEASAVNLKDFTTRLGKLPASQYVVFLDACREDPTPGRGLKPNTLSDVITNSAEVTPQQAPEGTEGRDQNAPFSSVTFFACQLGQRAYEDADHQHGAFTYWILDALKNGPVARPDGKVDMGLLATYVSKKVADWSQQTSTASGVEINQTPVMVSPTALQTPVVLMQVKRPLPSSEIMAAAPRIDVVTYPANADVKVNGKPLGMTPVAQALEPGDYNLDVTAPGYGSVQTPVKALGGYEQQITVRLPPGARSASGAPDPAGAVDENTRSLYQRALDAETQQEWEAAEAGYKAVLAASPQFEPAYQRLGELQLHQDRNADAAATFLTALAHVPPGAHDYSLLARAYSAYADKGPGDIDPQTGATAPVNGMGIPGSQGDAADLAVRAANEAVKADAGSAEAQRALGFALVAADDAKGKNRRASLAAFGQALFLDPKNASSHYGMGYGLHHAAMYEKDTGKRNDQLQRAINELKAALDLRPDYYEAHRDLAYCYHEMGDTNSARTEYQKADANRGGASDKDEVAGENVALAAIYKKDGDQKASDGYAADARDITPDLKKALTFLAKAGLQNQLIDYLPGDLKGILQGIRIPGLPGGISLPIPGGIHLPGGFHL